MYVVWNVFLNISTIKFAFSQTNLQRADSHLLTQLLSLHSHLRYVIGSSLSPPPPVPKHFKGAKSPQSPTKKFADDNVDNPRAAIKNGIVLAQESSRYLSDNSGATPKSGIRLVQESSRNLFSLSDDSDFNDESPKRRPNQMDELVSVNDNSVAALPCSQSNNVFFYTDPDNSTKNDETSYYMNTDNDSTNDETSYYMNTDNHSTNDETSYYMNTNTGINSFISNYKNNNNAKINAPSSATAEAQFSWFGVPNNTSTGNSYQNGLSGNLHKQKNSDNVQPLMIKSAITKSGREITYEKKQVALNPSNMLKDQIRMTKQNVMLSREPSRNLQLSKNKQFALMNKLNNSTATTNPDHPDYENAIIDPSALVTVL